MEGDPPVKEFWAPALSKAPRPAPIDNIRRSWKILASFWAVVIFFGLPFWWHTTSVYRAPLPQNQMENVANGDMCKPSFALRVAVEAMSSQSSSSAPDALSSHALEHLLKRTQHALNDLNDFSIHH